MVYNIGMGYFRIFSYGLMIVSFLLVQTAQVSMAAECLDMQMSKLSNAEKPCHEMNMGGTTDHQNMASMSANDTAGAQDTGKVSADCPVCKAVCLKNNMIMGQVMAHEYVGIMPMSYDIPLAMMSLSAPEFLPPPPKSIG